MIIQTSSFQTLIQTISMLQFFFLKSLSYTLLIRSPIFLQENLQFISMDKQNQPSKYIVLETLGEGSYSTVKLGIDKDGNYVAIKQYHPDQIDLDQFYDQITILKTLDHPNIVKIIDWKEQAEITHRNGEQEFCSALIIEYFSGGSLYQIIEKSGYFSQKVTRTYFLQIIKTLKYIHQKGFVHLDIKPQNIMLSEKYDLKIVDFGLSCLKTYQSDAGFFTTPTGSTGFQSPEMLKGEYYQGTKADIFAAGVTLFFMYACNYPFKEATQKDQLYKFIIDKNQTQFWRNTQKANYPVSFSNSFKKLFIKMVSYDPKQRLTIPQILSHQWSLGSPILKQLIIKDFNEKKQRINMKIKQIRQYQGKKEKHHLYMNMGHFSLMRGTDDISSQLLILIQQEKNIKRELKRFDEKKKIDIILHKDTNPAYAVARLKDLLTSMELNLHSDPFTPIDYETVPLSSLLRLSPPLSDNLSSNQIEARFQRKVQLEDDNYIQSIKLKISIGKNYDQKIVFRIMKISSSNEYAFRRIVDVVRCTLGEGEYM